MPDINFDRILDAILATDVSPTAREAGAPLVEAWVERWAEHDARVETVLVESGFQIWLDDDLLVIGVQDRIARDDNGIFGCEWKTAKEPKRNKAGCDSAWWNEHVWIEEITNGPQVGIYALALNRGMYYEQDGVQGIRFNVQNPRILVRAAVKSSPVRFWPERGPAMFQYPNALLDDIANGLRAKAVAIRALRAAGIVPWQLTGKHCFPYQAPCPYLEKLCSQHIHPNIHPIHPILNADAAQQTAALAPFDPGDPAARLALPHIPAGKLRNPNLVILSASSYETASNCLEKYRLVSGALAEKEKSIAMETGTVLHAGVAALYQQLREQHAHTTNQ